MRSLFLLLLLFFCAPLIKGQNCDYLEFKKGAAFERETYDGKDKKTGTVKSTVKAITETASGKDATVHAEYFDAKEVKQHEGDVKVICKGDQVLIDISDLVLSSPLANNPNFELKIESSTMAIPTSLSVGQSLPATTMSIKVLDNKSGQEFGAMKVNVINRKVEGKEPVTTPAGTFDCFKITAEMKMEMFIMGVNQEMPSVKNEVYISKGLGTVKTVSYNENGEVSSYSVLSKYTK